MPDDITIPIAALGGSGGLLSLIGGYFIRSHNERLKKIETDNEERLKKIEAENKANADAANGVAMDLMKFQRDAEVRYAKEETMQASLARVHDRLDMTATKDDVRELRDDIKILIGKAGAV